MVTFIIILILIILFFGGIIWIIFLSTKEKIKKNDGDHNHGHDDHGHTPPSKKMSVWGWIWNIIAVLVIAFLCLLIFGWYQGCQREKENPKAKTQTEIVLDRGIVKPGQPWVTYVGRGYNFRFITYTKTSFYVEYTSVNGGYTDPVYYEQGKDTEYLPPDATDGPARVSVGPENIEFEVSLIKY